MDIGGTFVDFCAFDEVEGSMSTAIRTCKSWSLCALVKHSKKRSIAIWPQSVVRGICTSKHANTAMLLVTLKHLTSLENF